MKIIVALFMSVSIGSYITLNASSADVKTKPDESKVEQKEPKLELVVNSEGKALIVVINNTRYDAQSSEFIKQLSTLDNACVNKLAALLEQKAPTNNDSRSRVIWILLRQIRASKQNKSVQLKLKTIIEKVLPGLTEAVTRGAIVIALKEYIS